VSATSKRSTYHRHPTYQDGAQGSIDAREASQDVFTSRKITQVGGLVRDYQTATEQYGVIVRYLRGAMEVLPKPECQLLLEFAEIEKNRGDRLHREIQERLAADRRGA
jgi:hypothetical protein